MGIGLDVRSKSVLNETHYEEHTQFIITTWTVQTWKKKKKEIREAITTPSSRHRSSKKVRIEEKLSFYFFSPFF